MHKYIFILILATFLQPVLCAAQVPDPVPAETSEEAKRKAMEEAMRRKKAEQEAQIRKMAQEEARRKAEAEAAKKSSGNKKPIPKSYTPEGTSGTAGIQLLKIPVAGPYYLGMRKPEYDSLAPQNPLDVTTEKNHYDIRQSPKFMFGRMYAISLQLPDSLFSNDLSDLTAHYIGRLEDPDNRKVTDSVMHFPSETDSSLQGEHRVKNARYSWHFKDHDITLHYQLTDLKNGTWKGFYYLLYMGNMEYIKGLGRLEEKEKAKITGY